MSGDVLAGITELRACVAWADNRPEREHNNLTPEMILDRFRLWDPEVDPHVVAYRADPDDPDYVLLLDGGGAVLGECEHASIRCRFLRCLDA